MRNKKILAVGAIFAVAVLLVSTFALAMSTNAITGRVSDIFGKEEKVSEFGDIEAVDVVDAYDIEQEMEVETGVITEDPEAFRSRKMVVVQGFAYNDDEKIAGLINGRLLKSTIYLSDDATIESLTKGILRIGGHPFKVERIGDQDNDDGTFRLYGGNSEGTLRIELDKVYNEGRVKSWKGNLDVVVGDVRYEGKVLLYTTEKILKPKPRQVAHVTGSGYEYTGFFSVDALDFKIQSVGNPNPKNIDMQVWGSDNTIGKSSWKLVESNGENTLRTYNGKILIYEVGDEDDRMEGEVVVTITRDGASEDWSGRITIDDESYGEERSGEIQIFENKFQKSKGVSGIPSVDYEDERENKAGKTSKAEYDEYKVSKKGFWFKVREFFGASN